MAANAAAIASPPPSLHQAEAATAATLAVKAKTLSGKELNMWTTIRSTSGTVIKTGFTPLYFTGEVGKAYSMTVVDYQNYLFSRWADNGSTSRTRTLTLSSSVTLTAYYNDGVSLSGSSLSGACTDGWYITGYFIPVESDYSSTSQVTVWTDAGSRTFYKGFVDAVRIEGSSRTRAGDYLGYWSGGYHITGGPVTATGKTL
ncbi:MAG: hypothetical protein C4292_03290 [Nitrososphaera sp.]